MSRPGIALIGVFATIATCGCGSIAPGRGGTNSLPRGETAADGAARTTGTQGTATTAPKPPRHKASARHLATPPLQALVTAQTENRLLVVSIPRGRVLRRIAIPGSPGYVDAFSPAGLGSTVVVVSSDPGRVTLLDRATLHPLRAFGGFDAPHIPAISPGGDYAYVTDDGSGRLAVIGLYDHRLLTRVAVGAGAHHLAVSPNRRRIWVALGQAASTITILSNVKSAPPAPASVVVDEGRPHIIGHFVPGFLAHDLLYSPDGRRVWITSADTRYVSVYSSVTRRLLFRVPGGAPPQHLAFAGGSAYITSGYGSMIERVSIGTGRVIRRLHAPYGSFDLDAGSGYVVTSSLFEGTLAIYRSDLGLVRVVRLAPSTEDVALSRP